MDALKKIEYFVEQIKYTTTYLRQSNFPFKKKLKKTKEKNIELSLFMKEYMKKRFSSGEAIAAFWKLKKECEKI